MFSIESKLANVPPAAHGLSPKTGGSNNLETKIWQFDVFLVEDSTDDREQISRVINKSPYIRQALCFDTGDRFLSFLATQEYYTREAEPDKPVLIFLDLHLPGLGGLKVLRHLKEHPSTKNIPIIITTTDLSPEQVQEAYDLKANAYLPKPVQIDSLHALIYNGWGPGAEMMPPSPAEKPQQPPAFS